MAERGTDTQREGRRDRWTGRVSAVAEFMASGGYNLLSGTVETPKAEITPWDADNLSSRAFVAGAWNAKRAKAMGGRDIPIVGNDPWYYMRQGAKVLKAAIEADPSLEALYFRLRTESDGLAHRVDKRKPIGVPTTGAADKIMKLTAEINEVIAEKELVVPIQGKWVGIAYNVADHAARSLERRLEDENWPPYMYLEPGDNPEIDRVEYWRDLAESLQPALQTVTT